jgi:dihydropteroate synthase
MAMAGSPLIRVLDVNSIDELADDMAALGVRAPAAKYLARVVRVDCPSPRLASVIEREMRQLGGAALWHADTVLLAAPHDQFSLLADALRGQPDPLPSYADDIERALRDYDRPSSGWLRCRGRDLPLGERTLIMGVLNVTPDSFSGDGVGTDVRAAATRAREMVSAGADIIDVGGESTRPGAEPVTEEQEIARVVPVIEGVVRETNAVVSIDSYKATVARAALDAGAAIINDISGLRFDARMASVAAKAGAPVVVMHIQGTPRNMQDSPHYHDLIGEIMLYLRGGVGIAVEAGVARDQVVIDPGFGFGKTVEHNLTLLRRLREFRALGQPLMIGTSRKSTIGKVLDLPVEERLEGTAATVAIGIGNGADIVRVHDVREMARVARMTDAIVRTPRREDDLELP